VDEQLRAELIALIAEDDAVRARLAADGSLFDGYHPEMEAVHRHNAAALRDVIARVGWPGRSLVGDDGAAAAWRIVQHAIGEPEFMRGCLAMTREAVAAGEADPAEAAFLEDRLRVFEGRPQLYGTQYDWDDKGGAMVLTYGVEASESVEDRRRAVGLPPLQARRPPSSDEPSPVGKPQSRLTEMELWASGVGWRKMIIKD